MHVGPDEPDWSALRRTVRRQGEDDELWVAWLLDWFRWSLGR